MTPNAPWSVPVRVDEVPETGRHVDARGERRDARRAGGARRRRCDRAARARRFDLTPARPRRPARRRAGERDGAADLRGHARAGDQPDRRGGRCGFRAAARATSRTMPMRSSSMPSAGRARAADREQRRSGRAGDRVPDPRHRSLPAQAGCGVRGAGRPDDAAAHPFAALAALEQKGHGQGIISEPGALCVRPPNRYGRGARQARSALVIRTVVEQDEHGPKGPNCARRHGGRHRACGRGSRRRPLACPPSRHGVRPVRRRGRGRAAARRASAAEGGLAARPHRRRGEDGRQAEPGAAPGPLEVVDVARDRRGEEGRGRCRGLGRQHRRPDGDGEVQPAHHAGHRAPGDRGALADAQGQLGRARCRRHDRRRRRASGRSRRDGQRDGARAVRSRAADRRPAQHRRRGGEGPGGGARGRPHPARGAACRSSTMWASSRATTSARERSTWW